MDSTRLPSPNDLLVLLTVARLGRFNAVAEALGTTHTTISRRNGRRDILPRPRRLPVRQRERIPRSELLAVAACIAVFALGIAGARRGWIRSVPERMRRVCALTALVSIVAMAVRCSVPCCVRCAW